MNSKTKSLTIFTLFMAFLISIFGFGFTGAINNNAIADEQAIGIAVINGETYTFDEAINKANEVGGEVTIEISGKVEYTASTANLNDALDVINFVGKTVDAQISITRNGSNGYISGSGTENAPTVNFKDLILSKPAGDFAGDAGFMNVYFTVYRVAAVNYNNCVFPNGACAQGCPVTYTDCEFANKTSGKYSLWVYANTTVTVENSEFTGVRGVKMYSESAATGGVIDNEVIITNTVFTESVTQKPAIVLTYGESVTLEKNTYSQTTGIFELDADGNPNGTTVTADIENIPCYAEINKEMVSCGVLVDGKIYTTLTDAVNEKAVKNDSKVALMYAAEDVVIPGGATVNTNGYEFNRVKAGKLGTAYVSKNGVWGEVSSVNAQNSVVLKLYSDEKLLANSSLNNVDNIIDGEMDLLTWNIYSAESTDEYWTTVWEENSRVWNVVPDKVELYVDEVKVSETTDVQLNGSDGYNALKWWDVANVKAAPNIITDKDGKIINMYDDINEALSRLKSDETLTIYEGEYTTTKTSYSFPDNVTIIGSGEVTINNKFGVSAKGILIKNINVNAGNDTAFVINGNGKIEDCNLTGGNGARYCYANDGDVIFENCVVTGSTYGIHFDAGNGIGNVIIKNCTITGWTSFGRAIENVSFEGTTFEEGYYNYIRFYQDASIDGCTFNPEMAIDVNDSTQASVTVDNSTVTDGRAVTELFEEVDKISSEITVDDVKLDCVITTSSDLKDFANRVNSGFTFEGKTIYIGANIDMENGSVVIGSKDNPFKGIFDGQNYTISNLVIDQKDVDYAGLFGYAENATIKNVKIENVSVVGKAYVGGIAGGVKTGVIENCHVSGVISIIGNYKVGGIVGDSYAKIVNCTVKGSQISTFGATNNTNVIEATYLVSDLEGDNVGGIVGFRGEGTMLLSDCTVENVTISGTRKIGGIAGSAFQDNNIVNCAVNNVVIKTTATEDYANDNASSMAMGGIVGLTSGNYAGGSLTGASVENLTFLNENNVTVSAGALTGGHRGTSAPVQSDGMNVSDNNVDVNTIEGATNTYLAPEFAVSNDGYWVINGVKTEYLAVVSVKEVENLGTENNVTTYRVHLTDGTYYDFTVVNGTDGEDGKDGTNGVDGKPGADGEDGKDGVDGTNGKDGVGVEKIEINAKGELVITYTDGKVDNLGKVTGENGADGKDGVNGVDGKPGANGADGADGKDGADGADGADGVTPQVRINEQTNQWEVSYDDGKTWTSLGVNATGKNGSNGDNAVSVSSMVLTSVMIVLNVLVVLWVGKKLRKK